MQKIIVLAVAIAVLGVGSAIAHDHDGEPVGREVAAQGVLMEYVGTLRYMRGEWFLVRNGDEYELHMGPYGHADEPVFEDGVQAAVHGFVYHNHIAPITVTADGQTHTFWTVNRFPAWAGSGEGGGRVAHSNPDIEPMGRSLFGLDAERRFEPPEDTRRFSPPDNAAPGFRNTPPGWGRRR